MAQAIRLWFDFGFITSQLSNNESVLSFRVKLDTLCSLKSFFFFNRILVLVLFYSQLDYKAPAEAHSHFT